MDESKNTMEIDLLELFQHFWKHKIFILILTVACAAVMFLRTAFFVDYTYTASGVLYIRSDAGTDDIGGSITTSEIQAARTLSKTYIETLKMRSFLMEVSNETGNVYSWKQINKMTSVSAINDTEYISVSVTTTDPQKSYDIASCICSKAHTKFAETFKGGEATVVDAVIYPEQADSKGLVKMTALGAILGIVIAAAILFVRKMLDRKLHRSDEITNRYDVSILGETAQLLEDANKKKKDLPKDHDQIKRVINPETDFDTLETYKSIRTNIMFSIPQKDQGKVILLTSACPGEGKTTTAINAAITFAQMGAKTILLDCDLRKARVHRYLQLKRNNGVTNLICGYTELAKAIKKDIRENLDILTAGDIPPNPAELLETEQFGKLISVLREHYDYIILDTPPITVVTDAAVMAKHADGIVLVTRQEKTTHDLLSIAIAEIRKTQTPILGAIVHDCSEKRKKYYYHSGYKYSYKYKYNYHYGDEPTMKSPKSSNNP